MTEQRTPEVGQHVIWHDPTGKPYDALITAVWTPTCINIVRVGDENETDQYGRQIKRETSQSHGSVNKVHGFFWRFIHVEPIDYTPPLQR